MPPESQPLRGDILVLEAQEELAETLEFFLSMRGYTAVSCTDAIDAFDRCKRQQFDLILIDITATGAGLDFVEKLKSLGGKEQLIVMTPFSAIKRGVEFLSQGAAECIVKPFQLEEVARTVDKVLSSDRQSHDKSDAVPRSRPIPATQRNESLPKVSNQNQPPVQLIGRSIAIKQLVTKVDRIAPTDSNVLITGATGTGKELIARAVHERSSRADGPFVDVNCSAIPETLFESEFFGHQRGTFTGAYDTRRGLFEKASGGTLFLDEVDTLNLSAQAKLLRVIQEHRLRRVGGRDNIAVDARIIAATNRDLKTAVREGLFRPDLFFRLRVVPLHVPELCEREGDITILVDYFLKRSAERSGTPERRFSREAMRLLSSYRWPGNVRELENVIEYALAISPSGELGIDAIPRDMIDGEEAEAHIFRDCVMKNASLEEVERRYILSMFERCKRHHIRTATALGIDRRTLYRKLQQYNINVEARENVINL